jgi:hypothetical protein
VDSQVVLVAVNLAPEILAAIEEEVDAQARALSRVDILHQSVAKSIIVTVSSIDDAFRFSNDYAPEHLILHLESASEKVQLIENAGSVFVGPYTPERYAGRSDVIRSDRSLRFAAAGTTHQEPITLFRPMGMRGSLVGSTHFLSRSTSPHRRSPRKVSRASGLWLSLLLIARVSTLMQTR